MADTLWGLPGSFHARLDLRQARFRWYQIK